MESRDSGLLAIVNEEITPAAFTKVVNAAVSASNASDRVLHELLRDGCLGVVAAMAALITTGPVGAAVGTIAIGATAGIAVSDYLRKIKPFGDEGQRIEKVLRGATPAQWSELAARSGREDFFEAFSSALEAAKNPRAKSEDLFRHCVRISANLGNDPLPGYEAPEPTAINAPKSSRKDWREKAKALEEESLISAPTVEELKIVGENCRQRIHDPKLLASIAELAKQPELKSKQKAMHMLLTRSTITPKEAGIPRDRFDALKKWAREGDTLTIAPSTPSIPSIPVEEPTIVEPVVEVAAKPSFVSVAPVSVEAVATAIVEEEVLHELPVEEELEEIEEEDEELEEEEEYIEEEDEEEQDGEPATVEVVKEAVQPIVAAKPAFFQAANIRQNTGLASTKDLIEACMKEAYRSTTLIGGERSGKTYYASVFSARMKAERGTTITYINLFDANRDSANDWKHADHIITANLNDDRCDVQAVFDRVYRRLREFQRETNTHLYFDEWVATTSRSNAWEKKAAEDIRKANSKSVPGEYLEPEGIGTRAVEVMNLMSSIASELSNIGKKQLKAMWLISPALRASDIYEQGKVMKSLAPAIVIIPPGKTVKWTHPTGIVQEIGFDLARYQVSEVNLAIPKSNNIPTLECDRAIFIGGTWYSLDGLEAEKPELETPVQSELFKDEPIAVQEPQIPIALETEDLEDGEATLETVEGIKDTTDRLEEEIAEIMAANGISAMQKLKLIAELKREYENK